MVHGIPGDRVLADGDVVSIDCGAIVDGWHGDAAITVALGAVPDEVTELMRVTEEALWRGIAAARLGGRVADISHAVETHVRGAGDYGIVEDYTGHGIGTEMHQPPNVPNYGRAGRGPKLVRGLALAVEPMITLGTKETVLLDDDWTVVTADGSLAAHYEHTFTLTPDGAWVLTALDGGEASWPARRSVRRRDRRCRVPEARRPVRHERLGTAGGEYSFAAVSSARRPCLRGASGAAGRLTGAGRDLRRPAAPSTAGAIRGSLDPRMGHHASASPSPCCSSTSSSSPATRTSRR